MRKQKRLVRPDWIPVTKRMLADAPVIQNIDEARRLFWQTVRQVQESEKRNSPDD